MAQERPPAELVADIEELLELLGYIVDPISERIQPTAEEALGLIFAWTAPVELRFRSWLDGAVKAVPGGAKSKA